MLFCCEAKTQTNLVYNGDFEIYDTCPTITSSPGNYQIEHCLGWYSPTYATSDYYNSCAVAIVEVPQNGFGFQIPFLGNAYCGILNQYCSQPSCDGWWVEYIQSKLNIPLVKGINYIFSCRIVLSDIAHEYAMSKFGALFTNNQISKIDAKPFTNITPQIKNPYTNYLRDTLNWLEIKGSFTAEGGEQFITLGFFPDTLILDTLRFTNDDIDTSNYGNYYYIDDVKLFEKECTENMPNVFTPNKDGINDNLLFTSCGEIIKTNIYNRWGIKVFETFDINNYWDGRTTSGVECIDGTYYYVVETKEKILKGVCSINKINILLK